MWFLKLNASVSWFSLKNCPVAQSGRRYLLTCLILMYFLSLFQRPVGMFSVQAALHAWWTRLHNAYCVTCNRICPEPTSWTVSLWEWWSDLPQCLRYLRKLLRLLGRSIGLVIWGSVSVGILDWGRKKRKGYNCDKTVSLTNNKLQTSLN